MKPIAVFYHMRLMGGDPPINFDHCSTILAEQTFALNKSGLQKSATFLESGLNGEGLEAAQSLVSGNILHHPEGRGEHPTLNRVREFAHAHPGWYLFYHHTKGAIHTGNEMMAGWRRCMEYHLVWQWRTCMEALDAGADSVGCHYMTPEKYGAHLVGVPYWGGNFWWARTDFLKSLPPMMPNAIERSDFYKAETWIGEGPRRPRVVDYHPVWPGSGCSQR